MYEFVEPVTNFENLEGYRPVGRGNKSPERRALEELPVGMAVNIPKDKASRGSIQNWTWDIGRKRNIKLSCRAFENHWHIIAIPLCPM